MALCGIGLQDTWMFEETVRENVHIYNKLFYLKWV